MSNPALRVSHSTDSLDTSAGGPPRTVSALAQAQGQRGSDVRVVALGRPTDTDVIRPAPEHARTVLVPDGRRAPARLAAEAVVGTPDLVHDHGLWLPTNHAVAVAALQRRIPRVVSTRGMLEPWARRHRRLKKSAAWALYQRRDLERAALLHATADSEAHNLRAVGLRAPIVVVPNGVTVPDQPAEMHEQSRRRRALFLSRVHPKKGLPMLLDAWAEVRPEGWELQIVGPSEGGHRAELQAHAARLGLTEVLFDDTVSDAEKWDYYRRADLFVLPTYSENFGVVVAEALACGVPVLTTTGAPWRSLITHSCGWWVEPETRAVADALRDATALPARARAEMGMRGRQHAATTYGWSGIAERMNEAYEWVVGRRSSAPTTVLP